MLIEVASNKPNNRLALKLATKHTGRVVVDCDLPLCLGVIA
jgi:hypothetical protein